MRLACVPVALLALLGVTGCGYVHFGRQPAPALSDAKLAEAYSNLATEHKMLKQELALARREGDTLRTALERSGAGGNATGDLIARLNEASRELAALRASQARLPSARTAADGRTEPVAASAARTELEEKLAATLRDYTQLQEENSRLRTAVTETRAENAGLQERLKGATAQAERMADTVAQLNTDLLAQKEARQRAEQAAAAVRAQLDTVIAHGRPAAENPGLAAPTASPSLQLAKAPPADSSATVELRLNTSQLRPADAAAARSSRSHRVRDGDTLESVSRLYYGTPDRVALLQEANRSQLGNGQALRIGMELQIPSP